VELVCDLFDEVCRDFCVVGTHGDEFDGPFAHGEAFAGGREVLEDLLHGLFRLSTERAGYRLRDEFDGAFNLAISRRNSRRFGGCLGRGRGAYSHRHDVPPLVVSKKGRAAGC
jgi:hypothetical protein